MPIDAHPVAPPAAAASRPAVEAVESLGVVIRWLRGRDIEVKQTAPDRWLAGRTPFDRAGLIEYANRKRALAKQPPFAYVGATR